LHPISQGLSQVSHYNGVAAEWILIDARCVPQENTKLALAMQCAQIACQTNTPPQLVLYRIPASPVQQTQSRQLEARSKQTVNAGLGSQGQQDRARPVLLASIK